MNVISYMWRSGFFIILILIALSCIDQGSKKKETPVNKNDIHLSFVSTFSNGDPESSSAEIVAYEPSSKRLLIVNSVANKLDILDFSSPESPQKINTVALKEWGASINSVSVANGLIAVAMENHELDKKGWVLFFNKEGKFIHKVEVGVKPDMLTFSPDKKFLLVANEGEPNSTYTVDPEGSISIIDLSQGEKESTVYSIDFKAYNDSLNVLKKKGVRIFGPNATVSQDLEPEYIAISSDSRFAWVTLQENNAVAKVDILNKKLLDIIPLGEKKLKLQSGSIETKEFCPVSGYYLPDGINSFVTNNKTYLVTANEGDIRLYDGFKESNKLGKKEVNLDPEKYPDREKLKDKDRLGKLMVCDRSGDSDGDGDLDEIYCYGGRSFSVWDENMKLIFDSGDDFERISCTEKGYCEFNEKYQKILEEKQWDVRGPEPESVVTGKIGEQIYAFITLERFGGIMVYNITDPANSKFVQYINSETQLTKGKSKPEGIIFISAGHSPNKKDLIVVANEGTSTVDVYEVSH